MPNGKRVPRWSWAGFLGWLRSAFDINPPPPPQELLYLSLRIQGTANVDGVTPLQSEQRFLLRVALIWFCTDKQAQEKYLLDS